MVIMAFKEGVTNHRMLEKLDIHAENLTTVVRLFDIADKCANAEEGVLFLKAKNQEDLPELPRPAG